MHRGVTGQDAPLRADASSPAEAPKHCKRGSAVGYGLKLRDSV
jgi:hypothetical protein